MCLNEALQFKPELFFNWEPSLAFPQIALMLRYLLI
jgi:hypothetical protein